MHFTTSWEQRGASVRGNGNAYPGKINPPVRYCGIHFCWAVVLLLAASFAPAQENEQFVGIWVGQGWVNTVELLLRSDGRYEAKSTTTGSPFGPRVDRGRYKVVGQSIVIAPYTYFLLGPAPAVDTYRLQLDGDTLSLSGGTDLSPVNLSMTYHFRAGSRADVLAREGASKDLGRRWTRHVLFTGDQEWTFRPGGYYCFKQVSENVPGYVEYERGRYETTGAQLTLRPYGGSPVTYEVDMFGTTLTLIFTNSTSGKFGGFEEVPGSAAEVAVKAAVAQAFLSDPIWPTGVWKIQKGKNAIDLLLRPDGYYAATNTIPGLRRILWGRYTLAGLEINLIPFVGQERYPLDEATFGILEQPFTVDYYDGELQLIDHKPGILQSVTLAYLSPGSRAPVLELVRQAQAERARNGWHIGIWEVNANADAWMEFTFRPDNRYIAKSGASRVPSQVERGQYVLAPAKFTLAPFAGNGPARGFELDLYDGNLFLIGDSKRLVIVRKIAGSETGVIEKTLDPAALKGERGSILGLWTANRPKESVELVFRPDGQFRLKRCTNNVTIGDYGLYAADMAARTLVYDSRVTVIQKQRLDFYGDTMTMYGGTNTTPSTYTVNLGAADAAIAASLAEDAIDAQVDAQWLARVQLGPTGPNGLIPQDIPADPNPGQILPAQTVFSQYQYYRKLIAKYIRNEVFFDTQEWHFFHTGRILLRFVTWDDYGQKLVQAEWGAYQVDPKPTQTDILHLYADNNLIVKFDAGDLLKMTLENGRRNLFLGKNRYPLDTWAYEYRATPCQVLGNPDASLINTGVSLATAIAPDPTETPEPMGALDPFPISIAAAADGTLTVSGATDAPRSLVLEGAVGIAPFTWRPLQSNNVPAGPFSFTISAGTGPAAFFRVRSQ